MKHVWSVLLAAGLGVALSGIADARPFNDPRGDRNDAIDQAAAGEPRDPACEARALVSTGGTMPRNFAIDPTGAYLFSANELTGNVSLFRIDEKTGRLSPTKTEVKIDVPVCVVFVPAKQ